MNKENESLNNIETASSQNEKISKIISSYKQAIELQPNNPDFYWKVAQLYYREGNLDNAIDNYEQAIRLKRDLPFKVYRRLADALKQQGRVKEAASWLNLSEELSEGETYIRIWNAFNQWI